MAVLAARTQRQTAGRLRCVLDEWQSYRVWKRRRGQLLGAAVEHAKARLLRRVLVVCWLNEVAFAKAEAFQVEIMGWEERAWE